MYLEDVVLPKFSEWVQSLDHIVPMEHGKKYARYFVVNNIDPSQIKSRGEVYNLFEKVYEYAEMKKIMNKGKMDKSESMCTDNLYTLANCIVWIMEHDAFDSIKYEPITEWGDDILEGKEHMV